MSAKEVVGYYGRGGFIAETAYMVRFVFNFFLERVAFFSPFRGIRTMCHRLRGVRIGRGVYIGNDILFDRVYTDQITIGDDTSIGDRCIITAHSNIPSNTRLKKVYPRQVKPVKIGRGVWIAPAVIILPGVTIGDEAVIGTGSVVTKDVPPRSVVAGVPAKVIKTIDKNALSADK